MFRKGGSGSCIYNLPTYNVKNAIKQTNFNQIYGNLNDQIEVIKVYLEIDKTRNIMKDELLPGEDTTSQDQSHA